MTLWKAWFDIRRRFYLCVVLVTLLVVPGTIRSAAQSARLAANTGEVVEPEPGVLPAARDPYGFLVQRWMEGESHMIFAILAVVLGVGGTMTLANAHSNLMTLSLPERRRKWLASQWAVVSLLVLALVVWEALIIVLAGAIAGLEVPAGRMLMAALLTAVSAALWVWPSMLSTAFTRDAVRAALVLVIVIVALVALRTLTGITDWGLRSMADLRAWQGAVPWKSLLAGGALTLATAVLVIRKFDATDY